MALSQRNLHIRQSRWTHTQGQQCSQELRSGDVLSTGMTLCGALKASIIWTMCESLPSDVRRILTSPSGVISIAQDLLGRHPQLCTHSHERRETYIRQSRWTHTGTTMQSGSALRWKSVLQHEMTSVGLSGSLQSSGRVVLPTSVRRGTTSRATSSMRLGQPVETKQRTHLAEEHSHPDRAVDSHRTA
jgi:hypothetical protein